MPFIVLFFGIGQAPAIVIIFIAAFFPVLLSTVSAIQNIDPVYIKVARNFGIKQPELLFKIVLPAVFPGIASGLHIALGTAWIFLVTGEMVGSQTGLGFLIIDMRNNLRNDLLMVAILTIPICVAINVVGDQIVQLLKLPIFLDVIGTVLMAMLAGPWPAAVTGILTNL